MTETATAKAKLATARAAGSATPRSDAAQKVSAVPGFVPVSKMQELELELERARHWITISKQMELHRCQQCTGPISPKADMLKPAAAC